MNVLESSSAFIPRLDPPTPPSPRGSNFDSEFGSQGGFGVDGKTHFKSFEDVKEGYAGTVDVGSVNVVSPEQPPRARVAENAEIDIEIDNSVEQTEQTPQAPQKQLTIEEMIALGEAQLSESSKTLEMSKKTVVEVPQDVKPEPRPQETAPKVTDSKATDSKATTQKAKKPFLKRGSRKEPSSLHRIKKNPSSAPVSRKDNAGDKSSLPQSSFPSSLPKPPQTRTKKDSIVPESNNGVVESPIPPKAQGPNMFDSLLTELAMDATSHHSQKQTEVFTDDNDTYDNDTCDDGSYDDQNFDDEGDCRHQQQYKRQAPAQNLNLSFGDDLYESPMASDEMDDFEQMEAVAAKRVSGPARQIPPTRRSREFAGQNMSAPLLPCEREERQERHSAFGDEGVSWEAGARAGAGTGTAGYDEGDYYHQEDYYRENGENEDPIADDEEIDFFGDRSEPQRQPQSQPQRTTSELVDRVFNKKKNKKNSKVQQRPSTAAAHQRKQTLLQKEKEMEEARDKIREEEKTIVRLRRQHESSLREAMDRKAKVREWCDEEREKTTKWVESQRLAIKRERQKSANAALLLRNQNAQANETFTKRDRDTIESLKATITKLKVDRDAYSNRVKGNEARLTNLVKKKDEEISRLKDAVREYERETSVWQEKEKKMRRKLREQEDRIRSFMEKGREREGAEDVAVEPELEPELELDGEETGVGMRTAEVEELLKFQMQPQRNVEESEEEEEEEEEEEGDDFVENDAEEATEVWLRKQLAGFTSQTSMAIQEATMTSQDMREDIKQEAARARQDASYVASRYSKGSAEEEIDIKQKLQELQDERDKLMRQEREQQERRDQERRQHQEQPQQQESQQKNTANNINNDGRVERNFPDGRRAVWYRNGTHKETYPDGKTVVRFTNGDVKTSYTKTGVVTYYYAANETTHTTAPDGLEVFEFPNKQTEHHWPDGRKEILFPDQTRKIIHVDGRMESIFLDGVMVEEFPDGRKKITHGGKELDSNTYN